MYIQTRVVPRVVPKIKLLSHLSLCKKTLLCSRYVTDLADKFSES